MLNNEYFCDENHFLTERGINIIEVINRTLDKLTDLCDINIHDLSIITFDKEVERFIKKYRYTVNDCNFYEGNNDKIIYICCRNNTFNKITKTFLKYNLLNNYGFFDEKFALLNDETNGFILNLVSENYFRFLKIDSFGDFRTDFSIPKEINKFCFKVVDTDETMSFYTKRRYLNSEEEAKDKEPKTFVMKVKISKVYFNEYIQTAEVNCND